MSTHPNSEVIGRLTNGAVLAVTIEDLQFTAYIAVSEPDIELVADIVPSEQFEQDGDVHVTAVGQPAEARQQIEDMAFNMNPGDTAVFLCADAGTYHETLRELGQEGSADGVPLDRLN